MDEVEIIRSSDGFVRLDTRADGDTAWLTREQIGDLFGRDVKTVGKQLANARREKLADASSVGKICDSSARGDGRNGSSSELDREGSWHG